MTMFENEKFVSVIAEDNGLTLVLKLEDACVFYRMAPKTGEVLIEQITTALDELKSEDK